MLLGLGAALMLTTAAHLTHRVELARADLYVFPDQAWIEPMVDRVLRHPVNQGVGRGLRPDEVVEEEARLNCIGDVVNTASRVQEATKEQGVRLLVTDGVRELVESEFKFGRKFACELRGKEGEHMLYEVLGRKSRRR